jgi:hypothetical protein
MRLTGPGTDRDLFWNFARAEFEIPTGGPRHTQPNLSARLRERILRGERELLTERDWGRLQHEVLSTRGTIVRPVLARAREWFFADATPADLAKVRVMNLRIFISIAPSRRLADLAEALDRGAFPEVWDPRFYRDLRARFSLAKMRGSPILVGERPSGPFTLIEGTTRLCVLASLQRHEGLAFDSVPVVLGLGAGFGDWEWF